MGRKGIPVKTGLELELPDTTAERGWCTGRKRRDMDLHGRGRNPAVDRRIIVEKSVEDAVSARAHLDIYAAYEFRRVNGQVSRRERNYHIFPQHRCIPNRVAHLFTDETDVALWGYILAPETVE